MNSSRWIPSQGRVKKHCRKLLNFSLGISLGTAAHKVCPEPKQRCLSPLLPGSLALPILVCLTRSVPMPAGLSQRHTEPLITRLWDCSQIFPGEDAERKRRELYMDFISSPRWIFISGGQGWARVLSRGIMCLFIWGDEDSERLFTKVSNQQFLVFIQQENL